MSEKRRESARRMLGVPELRESERSGRSIVGTLRFLTPVFGGGVRVNASEDERQIKDADLVTRVRSASVRGQLREWWRRACGFDTQSRPIDLEVLRDRESVLWGWASTQDRPRRGWVSLEVDSSGLRPSDIAIFKKNDKNRWSPSRGPGVMYGTFPLSPANANGDLAAGVLHEYQGTFRVTLRADPLGGDARTAALQAWPDAGDALEEQMWDEVERTWLAWTTFGGFGGRTRRGFGAVWLEGGRPVARVLERLGWGPRCVMISASGGSDRTFNTGLEALEAGLVRLKDFRQAPTIGRNPGTQPNRPGRSRWPEPDELRRITRTHARQHPPVHPVARFPRAAFGMPIIFHFKDQGDPPDQTLQPAGAERLASPLVIRPVRDGEVVKAAALRLPTRDPLDGLLRALELREGGKVSGFLSPEEQAQIQPLLANRDRPEAGADAVFHPFLRFFRGNVT